MYTWLQADLAANLQRWTVVYFHHPPYTKGSHNSDSEVELANMRQNIIPLLESWHVDLVLSGHSHVNERTTLIKGHYGLSTTFNSTMIVRGGSGQQPNPYTKTPPYDGTVYALCGTGGKLSSTVQTGWPMPCMYYSNNTNNASLVIDVTGDVLDCKYLSSSGTIIDQFTIEKVNPRFDNRDASGKDLRLFAFPNPFTDEITISYSIPAEEVVRLEVFNAPGKKVYSISDGTSVQPAGVHEHKLSASSAGLVPGIYVVKMTTGSGNRTERIIFVK
jgi:hypothetical protein